MLKTTGMRESYFKTNQQTKKNNLNRNRETEMLCAWPTGRHIVGTLFTCVIELKISLRKNTKRSTTSTPASLLQVDFHNMQSGGGGQNHDTSTLNGLCRYAWVCVWEEKQKVQITLLFLQPPSPASSPHTLDLVQICGPR